MCVGYADDISLVAPSLYCLKKMISICETFANKQIKIIIHTHVRWLRR